MKSSNYMYFLALLFLASYTKEADIASTDLEANVGVLAIAAQWGLYSNRYTPLSVGCCQLL